MSRDSLKVSQETSGFPVRTCGAEADSKSLEVGNSGISACLHFCLCLAVFLFASVSPSLPLSSVCVSLSSFRKTVSYRATNQLPTLCVFPSPSQSSLQGLWFCCFRLNSTSITFSPSPSPSIIYFAHLQTLGRSVAFGLCWVSFRLHSPIIDLPTG